MPEELPEPSEPTEPTEPSMYESIEQHSIKRESLSEDSHWTCSVLVEYIKNTGDLDIVFKIEKGLYDKTRPVTFLIDNIIKLYNKDPENDKLADHGIGILKKKYIKRLTHTQFLKLDKKHNDSTNIWYSWPDILNDNYQNVEDEEQPDAKNDKDDSGSESRESIASIENVD